MRAEGIPVSWQYPRTPGDINPYIITLKKVPKENEKVLFRKKIPTRSQQKDDSFTVASAAFRRAQILDTPCISTIELHRSQSKTGNSKQEAPIICKKAYRSLEKITPSHCKVCHYRKKRQNHYQKLSKEVQKLKSEVQNLKHSVLVIKSECSQCGKRKTEQMYCNNKFK